MYNLIIDGMNKYRVIKKKSQVLKENLTKNLTINHRRLNMNKESLTTLIDNLIQKLAVGKLNSKDFYEEIKLNLLPKILNTIMKEEREIFLKSNEGEYGNGYSDKTLYFNQIPIELKVPRTRTSNFYPSSIPKYSRFLQEEYSNLIESLLISSKSIESLKLSLKRLNLPVNDDELNKIIQEILLKFNEFMNRELSSDWFFIFIDAKGIDVKDENGKVKRGVIFTVVGVSMEGKKEILSSMLFYGDENLQMWKEVLLNLKNRGVTRCLMFITDNFSGLVKLIQGIFPLSFHQLCLVHMIRNAKLHLTKEDFEYFQEKIAQLERVNSYDEGYNILIEIIERLKDKYPKWIKELKEKAEHYVMFTRFPKYLRARIKSTNQSENIHKELERIRINSGGYFQSEKILYAKWFIFIERLHKGRWSKPDPLIKGYLNELNKMFQERFEKDDEI